MLFSDPRKLIRFPSELVSFYLDLRRYRKLSPNERIEVNPVLFQKNIRSSFDAHYVYQAAWAIRKVRISGPSQHTDISSNIPYVAALSAIVPVRFCEFRPPILNLPNLTTQHCSILSLPFPSHSVESLSCLHVLEHIGLGRYGDPVDPRGFELACDEIARVMAPGGNVYLSIPVGRERICFNMHRVSDPRTLPKMLGNKFKLKDFSLVNDSGEFMEGVGLEAGVNQNYACGLYWFTKESNV